MLLQIGGRQRTGRCKRCLALRKFLVFDGGQSAISRFLLCLEGGSYSSCACDGEERTAGEVGRIGGGRRTGLTSGTSITSFTGKTDGAFGTHLLAIATSDTSGVIKLHGRALLHLDAGSFAVLFAEAAFDALFLIHLHLQT